MWHIQGPDDWDATDASGAKFEVIDAPLKPFQPPKQSIAPFQGKKKASGAGDGATSPRNEPAKSAKKPKLALSDSAAEAPIPAAPPARGEPRASLDGVSKEERKRLKRLERKKQRKEFKRLRAQAKAAAAAGSDPEGDGGVAAPASLKRKAPPASTGEEEAAAARKQQHGKAEKKVAHGGSQAKEGGKPAQKKQKQLPAVGAQPAKTQGQGASPVSKQKPGPIDPAGKQGNAHPNEKIAAEPTGKHDKKHQKQEKKYEKKEETGKVHHAALGGKPEKQQRPAKKNQPLAGAAGAAALSPFQLKLLKKLKGGHFRFLNEQLYTSRGQDALSLFTESPDLFQVYHEGFRSQVEEWPVNPVDVFLGKLRSCPSSLVVADFGCGEAKIAESALQKVHSFDLHPVNERVTVCNIAHVPLPPASVDVGIFCLSLMGTDWQDFVCEAHRVLKPKGVLWIAEVMSRFPDNDTSKFVNALRSLGFDLTSQDDSNRMFVILELQKSKRAPEKTDYQLKPCIYKRR